VLKKYVNIILVGSFFLIYLALFLYKLNYYGTFTPEWDESHHLRMAYRFFSAIKENNTKWLLQLLTESYQIYPPLYHLLTSVSYKLVGTNPIAGAYTNIPFIFILMFSLYGIGKHFGYPKAGVLAAVLTPILPVFLALQERAAIDYSSVSLFLLSFYLMFKTEGLTKWKYTLLYAFTIVLNLLVKWPFVVPSIPLAFYVLKSFMDKKDKRHLIIFNTALIIYVSLIGLIWYSFNLPYILNQLAFFWDPNGYPQILWNSPNGLNLRNFLFYLYWSPMGNQGVGPVVLTFFYGSIIYLLLNIRKKINIYYPLASALITYLVLTYLNDKSEYYFAYAYPFLMLATIVTILSIKNNLKKIILITFLSCAIFANYFLAQLNSNVIARGSFELGPVKGNILPAYFTKFSLKHWPTAKIAKEYLTWDNCPRGVLVFPDFRYINTPSIKYYMAIYGRDRSVVTESATSFYNPALDKTFNMSHINNFSCIISKSGRPGLFANSNVLKQINDTLSADYSFTKHTLSAPDETEVYIFIKNNR
jgi:4-amino-4-deoxy-L-arabinose transferase-like glycosyltransferase